MTVFAKATDSMAIAGKILFASLQILLTMYVEKYRKEDLLKTFVDDPPDLNLPVEETYDFIIGQLIVDYLLSLPLTLSLS